MQKEKLKKEKKWILLSDSAENCTECSKDIVSDIARTLSLHPVTAQLLFNRGYQTIEQVKAFLGMENEVLCNPFLLRDIEAAVSRALLAVEKGEKITVFGDYDVDGVTAVCILYIYLKSKGAQVDYYIPNREGEGYGMSKASIDKLASAGTRLIITVDTGITANAEIEYAATLGVDVLVTDHHECRPELPKAVAVINPHRPDCPYPYKDLAGVGVVFRFMCAYEETETGQSRLACMQKLYSQYADLVAIGTIADVMPLTGENKLIVSFGLRLIANTQRLGLRALIEVASARSDEIVPFEQLDTKITSSYIGYTLAPRINAAGRIDTASMAVELFLAEDHEKALAAAKRLCDANRRRQDEENKIITEAYEKIEAEHDFSKDLVIVLDADHWHQGVIGIVASRITERYGLPCILVSFKGHMGSTPDIADQGKGSGRSVKGMNLVDALAACGAHLVKYGGHELAAGLSVTREELPRFRQAINEYARKVLSDGIPEPVLLADCRLSVSDMKLSLVEDIRKLEPFGAGNPMPLFVTEGLTVYECTGVSRNKHTKLVVGDGHFRITAMYFSHAPEEIDVAIGDKVSLLFQLDENEWNGRKSAQLIVRDLHKDTVADSDVLLDNGQIERARMRFQDIWRGGTYTEDEDILPCRDNFADVYRYIVATVRGGKTTMSHTELLRGLANTGRTSVGYIKLKFIIRVFQEVNLLGTEETMPEQYSFHISYAQNKVDLEKSTIMRRLRSQMR